MKFERQAPRPRPTPPARPRVISQEPSEQGSRLASVHAMLAAMEPEQKQGEDCGDSEGLGEAKRRRRVVRENGWRMDRERGPTP